MESVAQLNEVFPWVGLLKCGVGDVLDAYLQLVAALVAKVVAQPDVAGKVEAGAELFMHRVIAVCHVDHAYAHFCKPA